MFGVGVDDDEIRPEEEHLLRDADQEMQVYYRRKYQTAQASRVFEAAEASSAQLQQREPSAVIEPSFDRMPTAALLGELQPFDRQNHEGAMFFVAQHRDSETKEVTLDPPQLDVIEGDAVVIRCNETTVMRLQNDATGDVLSPHLSENGSLVFKFFNAGKYSLSLEGPSTLGVVPFKVTVVPPHTKLRQNIAKVGALAIGGVLIAAFVLLAIGLWLESSSLFNYLVSKTNVPSLYGLEKKLQNLFFDYSFDWFLIAAVVLLVLLVVRVAMCFRVERVHQFRRGYAPRTHLTVRWISAAHSVLCVVLVLVAWHMALSSNSGFNAFLATLSNSATATLNMALSAGNSVDVLVQQLPRTFPGVEFPRSAGGYINETISIVNSARTWSEHGVDLASGGFRILAVLRFVVFIFTLIAASSSLIGSYFANGDLVRSGVWIHGIALAACVVGIGANYFMYGIGKQTYDIGHALETRSATEATFTDSLGLSDSVVLRVIVQCDQTGILSQDYLNDVTHAIVDAWNSNTIDAFKLPTNWSILNPQNTKQIILTLVDHIQEVENLLLSSQQYLGDAGRFINETAPMLNAALTVTRTSAELSDCAFLQTALELSLPKLRDDALAPLLLEIQLSQVLMALLFVGMFISVITSFVIRRPRKTWYCRVTRRWFRFKISYYVHRIVTMRLASTPLEQRRLNGNPRVQGVSWVSVTGALIFGYLSNHVCSVVQLFLGVMLIILNFSLAANQLPIELLIVAFASVIPAVIIPLEFKCIKGIPAVPPFLLRLASTVVSIFAVWLTVGYSKNANDKASSCISRLLDAPTTDGSSATAPPNPCSPDAVFRDVEMSVYAIVVGVVSALAVVSGIALVFNSSRRLFSSTYKLRPHTIVASLNKIQSMAVNAAVTSTKKASRCTRCLVATLVVAVCIFVPLLIAMSLSHHDSGSAGLMWHLPDRGCNGDEGFCHRPVNHLVWAVVHNAMSTSSQDFVAPNNFYPLSQALDIGFRAFTVEVTSNGADGSVPRAQECHGNCRLGGYSMSDDLNTIANFLMDHPSDVVILFVNQQVFASDIAAAVNRSNASGMLWQPAVAPQSNAAPVWPTLQSLIDANQRFLMFTNAPPGTPVNPGDVPWLVYEFDWIAETFSPSMQLANLTVCAPGPGFDNGTGMPDAGQAIFLNHFVSVPYASATAASQANMASSLQQQYDACRTQTGVPPTFVAVDFWSLGDTLSFAFEASGGDS